MLLLNYKVFHAVTTAAHLVGYIPMCTSHRCLCMYDRKPEKNSQYNMLKILNKAESSC